MRATLSRNSLPKLADCDRTRYLGVSRDPFSSLSAAVASPLESFTERNIEAQNLTNCPSGRGYSPQVGYV